MKRILLIFICAALCLSALPVCAEETRQLTQAEIDEVRSLDEVDDETPAVPVAGPTYHEPELSEFSLKTPALYTCKVKENFSLFRERDTESAKLVTISGNTKAEILYVGTDWAVVRWSGVIGYIRRKQLSNCTAVDPTTTPPYGVQKHSYLATTASTCHVRKSMSPDDECWVVLNPGTMLSLWKLQDGWAIVNYMRSYGYIDLRELKDLIPVSPTDEPLRSDTPIAAYTSYYNMAQTETNLNRLVNIDVGCQRLTRVMQPNEKFNFNEMVGPYNAATGYKPAPVLINGTSRPGYGGGTCQVSSTLYNALLQLPGVTIEYRRPHGPNGASYLPHGVDAAVGNSQLNLIFRNSYDFPIRIEGHTSYDGALLMVVYRADTM